MDGARLAPWTEPASRFDWEQQSDWDGNAYQGLLDAYAAASGARVVPGERIARGTAVVPTGLGYRFVFPTFPFEEHAAKYPECAANPNWDGTVQMAIIFENEINVYQLVPRWPDRRKNRIPTQARRRFATPVPAAP